MIEILVSHPETNRDSFRRYSSGDDNIPQLIRDFRITPQEFPRACDLSSGDGPVALMLVELGWKSKDITCIDLYRTETPLIQGVSWMYMDLRALAYAILYHEPLPAELERLRGAYDVVTHLCGYLPHRQERAVNTFFLRDGGFAFSNSIIGRIWKKDLHD